MSTLAERQARFLAALHNGPADLETGHFATAGDRLLLAMQAHANTVSHARLTALENSFPRTRSAMGIDAFHKVARDFIQTEVARAAVLAGIGAHFAKWLQHHTADASLIDLAQIEWAWLEAYHAIDVSALMLSDLAGMTPEALLSCPIRPHPTLYLVPLAGPLHPELTELAAHRDAVALLVTRPEAEVRLSPLTGVVMHLAARAGKFSTLGNLFDAAAELMGDGTENEAVLTLIGAGAFMRPA